MVRDITITRADWLELVFEGKNKAYGAYVLREESGRRHLLAYLGVVAFTLALLAAPDVAGFFAPATAEKATTTGEVRVVDLSLPEENKVIVAQPLPVPKLKTTIKYTVLLVAKDEEVPDDQELRTQDDLNRLTAAISVADVVGNDETGEDIADLVGHQAVIGMADTVYFSGIVEQQPEFVGGARAMRSWIGRQLRYPSLAEENGVQGVVIVQFVVGSNGAIRDVTVARSADPSLDAEAVRMVGRMPAWIPGRQGGVPVPVRFSMPVTFRLQER
ncbi:MAG: energy transducer TonB [Odoribacteraceae bacterium]|jgi:protein TonB|nr:energy transducer TonB [Odoribacteraceae bacterium]